MGGFIFAFAYDSGVKGFFICYAAILLGTPVGSSLTYLIAKYYLKNYI
jgi:hypothetical protein